MTRPEISFADLLDGCAVLPFAHRGASLVAPENTMAAFAAAVSLGFNIIETDIQVSQSGTPYVFHDDSTLRMTGQAHPIADLSDAKIAQLRISGKHAIPTLAAVFEEFPDICFNLDAKSDTAPDAMARVIRRANAQARVCIGSFSDRRIARIKALLGGDICYGLGMASAARFFLASRSGICQKFSARCVQLPISYRGVQIVSARTIQYAHKVGLKLHVWTVNDAAAMTDLLALGCDGIMTDDCARLKTVMQEYGAWPSDIQTGAHSGHDRQTVERFSK